MTGKLPSSASVALPMDGAKLHAPAADRNCAALCELLLAHAPHKGRALEIASGTGQHIAAFATALPGLSWQPSEPDAARRASIDAYVRDAGVTNVAPAIALDATADGWHGGVAPQDLIFLANLLHLIPTPAAQCLIAQAALALAPRGTLILYGPFRRAGRLTSAGDVIFDAELRAADPAIGYKDTADVITWLDRAGLAPVSIVALPANNLGIIAGKP
ncbi:DUF938 domain-containing protein [Roseobacter sp. GAI101]|uniref:DUF938 domain-containing protein n=1 Tax=Roseobacter sp. (strain GAI101) TaxID=391589 RepID=UPI00018720E1|nr:DUF938 domain-containing protein [Roseobacter sp. GAI101]EEB83825.1 generic methyltransferase [Roseobacter sp. GAI101]